LEIKEKKRNDNKKFPLMKRGNAASRLVTATLMQTSPEG
jgi:hypothetical protein